MKRMFLMKFWLVITLFWLQPVQAQAGRIVMDLSHKTFSEAVEIFKQQTGTKFLYNQEKIQSQKSGTLQINANNTEDAIAQLLKAFKCTYKLVDGVVVVKNAPQTDNLVKRKITGRVTDKDGNPLPGVSIIRKGTTIGITTDVDGNFTLVLTGEGPIPLVFSFIGMETKEVICKDDKPIKVVMEETALALDEVVVDGGYQKLPRKDMVGSFTTVKADDIRQSAYNSIDQMLQGRVAGLVAVNNSSRVGRAPKLTIRGVSTLLGNTDPLWVVDGIIQPDPLPFNATDALTSDLSQMVASQVSWLNPADIESVTVLKDASATAVYGSKASNGVIVVTTKKGQADRLSVNYSLSMGIRFRPNYDQFDFMNSQERIRFSKEAYDAGARYQYEPYPQTCTYEGLMFLLNNNTINEEFYNKQVSWLETVNTDWFKLLTRNSFNHNHNLSISGGSKKSTYTASFSYNNSKGVEIGNDTDQFNARLGFNSELTERLRVHMSMNSSIGNSYGFGAGINPMDYATTTSRALPAYTQDGDLLYYQSLYNYQYNKNQIPLGFNILNERDNSYAKMRNNRFDASLNIDYKILPWVSYQLVGGLSSSMSDSRSYAGERTTYIAQHYRGYDYGSEEVNSEKFNAAVLPYGGELYTSDSKSISYNMQHKLVFSHNFKEGHRLNAMLAAEIRSTTYRRGTNTVWGYIPERGEKIMEPTPPGRLKPIGMEIPTDDWGILKAIYNGKWTSTERTDNYFSFFATLAYSFKDKYVLNANIRNDVSNRFGQDVNKRFDPTFSFGLSWRLGEEAFIKDNISWLDQLNVRGTFGIQGNVVNSISPELILTQGGIQPNYNEFYTKINSLPNPLLKWERTKTWNFGLDIQLLRGISMTLEYYGRRSNAIVDQDAQQEYGVYTMKLNGGLIKNHGVEYSINFTPYKRDNFAWNIGINASKNWNKAATDQNITGENGINKGDFLGGSSNRLVKKGYPINSFWSYSFAGLEHETGYPTFNKIGYDSVDPEVDPSTFLVYSGPKEPFFTGGFNTSVRWHSLSLSANFSALLGGKKRLVNPYDSFTYGQIPNPNINFSRMLNNRWKKPGDEAHTIIPALWTDVVRDINATLPDGSTESIYDMWGMSDAMVVNASFLRCNQISLSWSMDSKLCKKFGARSFSVNASVSNVFVIASKKFNGFDPELADNSVMPRMFSFGFNVGF